MAMAVYFGIESAEHFEKMRALSRAEREMGGLVERMAQTIGPSVYSLDAAELAEVVANHYLQARSQIQDDPENAEIISTLREACSKIAKSSESVPVHHWTTMHKFFLYRASIKNEIYNRTLEHTLLLAKMSEVNLTNHTSDSWLQVFLAACNDEQEYQRFLDIAEDFVAHKSWYDSINQGAMERVFESTRTEILSDADPLHLHEDAPISEAARRICALVGVETFQE